MRRFLDSDTLLGLACFGLGMILLLVWIPLDIETGVFQKIRRHTAIGDAFLPVIAAWILIASGGLLSGHSLKRAGGTKLAPARLRYLAKLLAVFLVFFILLRWTGPVLAGLAGLFYEHGLEYRLLRDSIPWKYTGFVTGGTVFVAGLIHLAGRPFDRTIGVIAFAIALGLALFYDLPFDNLLLPPNGDV